MSEWQPIETAPKRGTVLTACWFRNLNTREMEPHLVIAWWRDDIGHWRSGFGDLVQPTHWMPLPEPPK